MKLGIGSYTYNWWTGVPGFPGPADPLTPERLLEVAASQRIRLVQIADNMPLDHLSAQNLDDLAGRARTLGIQMETGTRGIRPTGLRQYIGISQRLGSRMLRTLIDAPDDRPSADEAVALLREIAPEFERAAIALGLENHERIRARSLRQIVERVGSRGVGICLDTANSLGCGEGLATVLDELADFAVNLHVKDFQVTRLGHGKGFIVTGVPAGEGLVDVPAVLERLARAGRDVNCILELWSEPLQTVEESIRRENEWAEQSLRYLRTLIPAPNGMDAAGAP
jgi:3-oxoisoapionate decarboxylase